MTFLSILHRHWNLPYGKQRNKDKTVAPANNETEKTKKTNFALAPDREASVAGYRVQGIDSSVWRPIFVRDSFADDDSVVRFFSKLSETNPNGYTSDKVSWKLESKGCFTVKSFYLKLLSLDYLSREAMGVKSFPYYHLEVFGTCQGVVFCLESFTWKDSDH